MTNGEGTDRAVERVDFKLSEGVKTTYRYVLQEFNRIEAAMRPLQERLRYMNELGILDEDKEPHECRWTPEHSHNECPEVLFSQTETGAQT